MGLNEHVVDIDGIVDHHCLNIIFVMKEISPETRVKIKI